MMLRVEVTRLSVSLLINALLFVGFTASPVAAPDNVCSSVTLANQNQIDSFDQSCEIIDGYLKIDGGADGGNISDLSPLSTVQTAHSLVIFNTTKLINLKGLEGLTSLSQCLLIQENPGLSSLTGLESLTSIGGSDLNYPTSQCSNLGLLVRWNPPLVDLDGLKNLTSVIGDLDLYNNDSMTHVEGLGALQNVTLDELAIWDNALLRDLDGLEGVVLTDTLYLRYNRRLSNVDGLRNLNATSRSSTPGERFTIEENWDLGQCEGLAPFFRWPGTYFRRALASFEDNDRGCETLDELWASVVVTDPEVVSVQTQSGRMVLDYSASTSNSPLFPVEGHFVACEALELDNLTFPLRTISNGQTVVEEHFFSSAIGPSRMGFYSRAEAVWQPVFKVWHPSPEELTATMTTPWGEELNMLNRYDLDSGDDNYLFFPEDILASPFADDLFSDLTYLVAENDLEGTYRIQFDDSIVTNASGRLVHWGVRAGTGLIPQTLPVQSSSVIFDTVQNGVGYTCVVEPQSARLNTYSLGREFEFSSQLDRPLYDPDILSIRSEAGVEATIIVEFSQPQAWAYEIQDYLVTCEAEGEEPAYGYVAANNAVVGNRMDAEGRVTQTAVVEGVNEEVEYSCSVTAYNRIGRGSPSSSESVTTEAVMRGLPIWLLYEASQ